MKTGEKKFIAVLIIITVIVTIIFIVSKNKGNDNKGTTANKEIEDVIDVNDEYYAGKNIYKDGTDIVIEGDEESKTVISNTKTYETDLKEASTDKQAKYVLEGVKVELTGNMTKVSGKIKSNDSGTHKVSILTKFYKEDGKVAGSLNTTVNSISSGETKNFSGTLMGDYTKYTQKTEVEFTN